MHPMIKKYFDPVSGLISATLMSVIVWFVNAGHGPWPATTAAMKQAAYTFFMGGLIAQLCRYLAARPGPDLLLIVLATLIPAGVTTSATYFVHSLKGTPEPILSTLPVIVLSTPLFGWWAWQLRKTAMDTEHIKEKRAEEDK